MKTLDIAVSSLAWEYILLLLPLAILLWYRVSVINSLVTAVIRMTVQLLFVGLYLQFIFFKNSIWLNIAWLLVMAGVADGSILRSCGLRLRYFAASLFIALLVGLAIPLLVFLGPVLQLSNLLDARYAIPIGGMILGNCLRANIIGIKKFYQGIKANEKAFLLSLSQGATLTEATRPFLQQAIQMALAPTMATMATIGLVSLPGMMTGVIIGGADPTTAIKYQLAIMISIFTGTVIALTLGIWLTRKRSFSAYGILQPDIFTHH